MPSPLCLLMVRSNTQLEEVLNCPREISRGKVEISLPKQIKGHIKNTVFLAIQIPDNEKPKKSKYWTLIGDHVKRQTRLQDVQFVDMTAIPVIWVARYLR